MTKKQSRSFMDEMFDFLTCEHDWFADLDVEGKKKEEAGIKSKANTYPYKKPKNETELIERMLAYMTNCYEKRRSPNKTVLVRFMEWVEFLGVPKDEIYWNKRFH